MSKELKVLLKRIHIEPYQKITASAAKKYLKKNNLKDCDGKDGALPCHDEVLVMNYQYDDDDDDDDNIFQDNAEITNTNVIFNETDEESTVCNEETKVEDSIEDDELCDMDTKQSILIKFEETFVESETEKKQKELSDERKWNCNTCEYRAKRKHHLKCHIKQAHHNKKEVQTEFECEHCMFKSKYKTSLNYHIIRFHIDKTETGSGKANTKPKKSAFEVQAVNIMDHCTLDKAGVYNCKNCSYTTSNKRVFLGHIVVHTVSKSKVIQCPDCPKKFTHNALQIHIRNVHANGLVRCPKCSYSTKWSNNLRRHIRQNKGRVRCKLLAKRRTPEQMVEERLKGRAPPIRSRRKIDSDEDDDEI